MSKKTEMIICLVLQACCLVSMLVFMWIDKVNCEISVGVLYISFEIKAHHLARREE